MPINKHDATPIVYSDYGCSPISVAEAPECRCDYVPPAVTSILVRKKKNNQYQVRVNGKGKWIHASYDEATEILTFSY